MPAGQIEALRRHGSPDSDQEIERGLVAMALASGNARRASRMLERYGLSVPDRTLYRWRVETFPARYAAVGSELLPRLRRDLDRHHREREPAVGEEPGRWVPKT
jgi:hypothetical protein